MTKSKKTETKGSEKEGAIKNWYKVMPESFITKYHNPTLHEHGIKHPSRMLIIGASGSGKTQLAAEILHRMKDTFGLLVICVKNQDEPIYNFIRSKLKPEYVEVHEGGIVPPVSKYKDVDSQILIIFDDLVNEGKKVQEIIGNYFIYGRKGAKNNKGITCMYIAQSYFGIPKICRLQASYVFLKKIASLRDLNMMMRDHNLGLSKEELFSLYNYCTDEISNFMLVDVDAPPEHRFRKNFDEVFTIPVGE